MTLPSRRVKAEYRESACQRLTGATLVSGLIAKIEATADPSAR